MYALSVALCLTVRCEAYCLLVTVKREAYCLLL